MSGVKTAISLDEDLFSKVNKLSAGLHISRSKVFALALQDFIQKQENQFLLVRLNEAYKDLPSKDEKNISKFMLSKQKKMIKKELW